MEDSVAPNRPQQPLTSPPSTPQGMPKSETGRITHSSSGGHGPVSPQRGPPRGLALSALVSPTCNSRSGPWSGDQQASVSNLPPAFADEGDEEEDALARERPGRAVVADFLRKLLRLSALRLADLCERLDFSPMQPADILQQVYTMVHYVIYNHLELMFNRHLDQLLLSALYGVCKVYGLPQAKFKEILQHYKKQPQGRPDVFRQVVIEQSCDDQTAARTGDIIEFYNSVLIPVTKSFVLDLYSKKAPLQPLPPVQGGGKLLGSPISQAPHSPMPSHGFSTPPAVNRILRPETPSSAHKSATVYVSSLRRPSPRDLGTPRSQGLAARMGESLKEYSSPAVDLTAINDLLGSRPNTAPQRSLMSTPTLPMGASPARPLRSPKPRPNIVRTPPQATHSNASTSSNDNEADDSPSVTLAPSFPSHTSPRSPRQGAAHAKQTIGSLTSSPGLLQTPPSRVRRQSARAVAAANIISEDDGDVGGTEEEAEGLEHRERSLPRLPWGNGDVPSPPKGLAAGLFYLDAAASALDNDEHAMSSRIGRPASASSPHRGSTGRGSASRPSPRGGGPSLSFGQDLTPSRAGRVRRPPQRADS
ncbi:hypothetical protein WJX73_001682 [Symbiochloris irregularis]|uniref:Retinoblastoma-associated protein B-box domain-containing protein n=1 Tax=Symbiochloris irregularis TaxID=706552 RepID=A0AAW1PSI9_9CHLO